jgi:hypothetical protein
MRHVISAGTLRQLEELALDRNRLVGAVPRELAALSQLRQCNVE